MVWNIFYVPYIGNNHPNWLIFFRGVAIPPTRKCRSSKFIGESFGVPGFPETLPSTVVQPDVDSPFHVDYPEVWAIDLRLPEATPVWLTKKIGLTIWMTIHVYVYMFIHYVIRYRYIYACTYTCKYNICIDYQCNKCSIADTCWTCRQRCRLLNPLTLDLANCGPRARCKGGSAVLLRWRSCDMYIYDHICRCSDIKHLILHYSYLHTYISMLKTWSYVHLCVHSFDVQPGQRVDSLRFFSWMQHVQANGTGTAAACASFKDFKFWLEMLLDTNLLMLIYQIGYRSIYRSYIHVDSWCKLIWRLDDHRYFQNFEVFWCLSLSVPSTVLVLVSSPAPWAVAAMIWETMMIPSGKLIFYYGKIHHFVWENSQFQWS